MVNTMDLRVPNPQEVLEALDHLKTIATRTPVIRSDELDRITGGKILIKCENLQRSGAFKFRGAYNRLSRLSSSEASAGVVAYSTGNHGQAVATVGRLLGVQTTIVMPQDAPAIKIAKARREGAEVVLYDRATQTREDIAARIATGRPVTIVPPGDDPLVIAGQGTVAAEFLADGIDPDIIVVPCGGGGLAAGTILATRAMNSRAQVWAAEPLLFDDTRRSLESGSRETNASLAGSICDALLAPTPAVLPFEINRQGLARVLVADDSAVLSAMRFAYEELRIVLEPGGATALAALLAQPALFSGKTVVVIASGGNVDPHTFTSALGLGLLAA